MAMKITLSILSIVFWFGFIGPFCMSATSDILVWGWPTVTLFAGIFGIQKLIKFVKDKSND